MAATKTEKVAASRVTTTWRAAFSSERDSSHLTDGGKRKEGRDGRGRGRARVVNGIGCNVTGTFNEEENEVQ